MEAFHVTVEFSDEGTPARIRALGLAADHRGNLVEDGDVLVVAFDRAPDAAAFAGALVDDTAPDPASARVSITAQDEEPRGLPLPDFGQVVATSPVETRSRGRLACGLSFRRHNSDDEGSFELIVPGVHERFGDVE